MDLYLVRHGESNIPADSVQSDYPLSELGREQAARVGERFRGLYINRLITTPFKRTQETAAAIAATTGIESVLEPTLMRCAYPACALRAGSGGWGASLGVATQNQPTLRADIAVQFTADEHTVAGGRITRDVRSAPRIDNGHGRAHPAR